MVTVVSTAAVYRCAVSTCLLILGCV